MKRYPIGIVGACLASCFLFALLTDPVWAATSEPVNGQTADFTLFDTLEQDAETQSNSWFATILGLVRPTFLILATIEICWAAAIWAFEKDNLNSLAVEIIKKIMFIGFFFALLQYAPDWMPTIAGTFVDVGERATGSGAVTTDGIIATGLAVIKAIWAEAPTGFFNVLGKLGQILVACFVTLGVIIAYVVIAAQYFTLKVESYILFAAGAIFLGLGSSSWTKEYVSKYLNYAINVGVRLLVMILILSLMLGAITRMGDGFTFDYVPLLKLLAVALLQAILGVKAPEMAGALLNGGIGLSAGSAASAGSSMGGALKTAAGLGVAAAATAVSAAQGAGNLGKAASAGRELAKQKGTSGGAATLSGLGSAAAATARAVPGKLVDAIKRTANGGNGGGRGRGQNPGVFDTAKQNLQARVSANAGGKDTAKAEATTSDKASSKADGGSRENKNNNDAASKSSDSTLGSKDPSGTSESSTTGGARSNSASGSSDSSSASTSPGDPPQGSASSSDTQPESESAASMSPSVGGLSRSPSSSSAPTSPGTQEPQRRPNKLKKASPPSRDSNHPSSPSNKDV